MTKTILCAGAAIAGTAISFAQQTTQPISPKTPNIKTPPAVIVPGPQNIDALAAKPLTAADAARIAVLRQRSLDLAKAAVRSAAGQRRTAQSALGPNVSLASAYNDVNNIKIDPSVGASTNLPDGFGSSITLEQLLFDFSHSEDLVRQAAYLEEAARRGYESSEVDLVTQVKQAFYTFVQNNSLVDAGEANVRDRQAQVDLAQARLSSGLGAPADLVNAKTFLAAAVLSLTQARMAATTSRIALAQIMGLDPRTPITAAPSAEESPIADDMNALVDQALKFRPEVAQATAVLKAAKAGLNAARTGNAPTLLLNATYGGRGNSDPLASQNTTLGLSVSWTLFDSDRNAGRIDQAKAGVDTAQAQLDLASQSVVADVAQAYLNLKSAEQMVTVTTVNVANAQEGVRLAEGRYKAGVTTFLEVTDAQTSLFSAQNSDVQAHAQVQQARAALVRAVGKSLEMVSKR